MKQMPVRENRAASDHSMQKAINSTTAAYYLTWEIMNMKGNAIVSEKHLRLKVKYIYNFSHQCLYVIIELDL